MIRLKELTDLQANRTHGLPYQAMGHNPFEEQRNPLHSIETGGRYPRLLHTHFNPKSALTLAVN
jgi:hypothetical protein